MRHCLLLGIMVIVSACSRDAAVPATPATPAAAAAGITPVTLAAPAARAVLSAEGFGPLRFGMSLNEAEQALGAKAVLPEGADPACSMVRFAPLPTLRFMVEQGRVTRADADAGVANALGVAVGDGLAALRARYPKAELTPHKYDADGQYLTFPSADGGAAIVLELSGGKVTRIRAGLQPAVGYVETCG